MLQNIVPIFRIFDLSKAREFYIDFLDFKIDWNHGLEENLPIYIQISKNNIRIHLSEHHGDSCPGSAIRISVDGIKDLRPMVAERHFEEADSGGNPANLTDAAAPLGLKVLGFVNAETLGEISE